MYLAGMTILLTSTEADLEINNYYISYSQSNWRISPSYGASEFSNSFNPHWRKTIERNHYDEENL